jgi:hypothetical protein
MVTFNIPRPNVIESDEGYSVEVLGPTGLRYSESGRILNLDSESLAGPSGIILFTQAGSFDGLSQAEKERIINNVRAAFKFRGVDIQVA